MEKEALIMTTQPTHTPTHQDIWDHSQASLQNLWSDCPELYQQVVRAVNAHQALIDDCRSSMEWFAANGHETEAANIRKVIARAEGNNKIQKVKAVYDILKEVLPKSVFIVLPILGICNRIVGALEN
jgi:hypothetical protein